MLSVMTTLEFLQHHFAKLGHRNTSCDPHLHQAIASNQRSTTSRVASAAGRLRPNALTGQVGTRSNFSGNSTYQESRYPAGDSFPPHYVRDDSARAHVKDKRERYAENRDNQHGLLKASGAESFRDRGGTR